MNNITYLFGAGASYEALPIVNQMPERMENLISFLKAKEFELSNSESFNELQLANLNSKKFYQDKLIESLEWMLIESANHASVDTFAKKLFIQSKYTALKKLKNALSVFFIFEQARCNPDKRYDAFLASIIPNSVSHLPENIKILSWNYDSQFEMAMSEYTEIENISSNQNYLKSVIKHAYNKDYDNQQGFKLFKLNGTTMVFTRDGWDKFHYSDTLKKEIDLDFITNVTRLFTANMLMPDTQNSLSFAWEREREDNSVIQRAIKDTSETDILVVIGYSFPFFNRDVDRKIIGAMHKLKKVYFQAPDAETLVERFHAFKDDLAGVELIPKFDVGQFFLPNEF